MIAACQQVKYGVQAVFGPSDPILGQHIHSICDALDIPHLEARLDLDTEAKEFSINLYPAQSLLNAAYQDIMEFLNWTKVAIIYEDDYGKYFFHHFPLITLIPFRKMESFHFGFFNKFNSSFDFAENNLIF